MIGWWLDIGEIRNLQDCQCSQNLTWGFKIHLDEEQKKILINF